MKTLTGLMLLVSFTAAGRPSKTDTCKQRCGEFIVVCQKQCKEVAGKHAKECVKQCTKVIATCESDCEKKQTKKSR